MKNSSGDVIVEDRQTDLRCKKYPYIHEYFVASFLSFNGTGSDRSVYVCIRKSPE